MARAERLAALAALGLPSCKAIAGLLVGAGAGAAVAGPPGAAAGGVAGLVVACMDVAVSTVQAAFAPHAAAPAPGSPAWLFAALVLGTVLAWMLVRYSLSGRYRGAIHEAMRQVWRAEGALHSREHER